MTSSARRRLAGFGVAAILAVGGGQWAMTHADAAKPKPAASVRALRWWPPRATTTTVRRTTTTTQAPTTTAAPATTTPPTTPAPITTKAPTTIKVPTTTRPPAPAPTTTRAPAPTTAPPTTPAPITGSLSAQTQQSMLAQVNALRATGTTCGGVAYPSVPALQLQGTLTRAADAHAADMASRNYFSHDSLDGTDPGTRLTRAGYHWSAWAENIAAGQPTPASVVSGWFASTGHCQNFMSSAVTQVGFGYAENQGSTYKKYWVADLGRPA